MKHTAFKITLGSEQFFEVMANPWSDVVCNPKDMSVSLLFSKDRPVVFQDSKNPAKRLVVTLVEVDIDEQGTLEYKPA